MPTTRLHSHSTLITACRLLRWLRYVAIVSAVFVLTQSPAIATYLWLSSGGCLLLELILMWQAMPLQVTPSGGESTAGKDDAEL